MGSRRSFLLLFAVFAATAAITPVCARGAEPNEIQVSVRREELPFIQVSGTITLPPDQAAGSSLHFNELVSGGLQRIAAFQDDREIAVETKRFSKPDRSESIGCYLPAGTSGPVRIEFDVNPTFYPPGSVQATAADARARVTRDLGVLRTTTILPQRMIAGADRIRFVLPEGWIAVTPWEEVDGAFVLGERGGINPEYIGIGPLKITEQRSDAILYRLAVCRSVERMDNESLHRLLKTEREIVGRPPGSAGDIFSVIVVPADFVRGGSAGRFSAVQPPDPVVLAHEMFHWWNRSQLSKPEANWFHEGFTEYFGIRAARDAGLIDADFAIACFADLNAEMRHLEREKVESLANASIAAKRDSEMARIVYSKGALLAMLMEQELQAQSRKLDELMSTVLASGLANVSNDKLRVQFHDAYDGALDNLFDRHVLQTNALPDLHLPPATGRTGVAKYLPDK